VAPFIASISDDGGSKGLVISAFSPGGLTLAVASSGARPGGPGGEGEIWLWSAPRGEETTIR